MTFGECREGENCTYYHPRICRDSMQDLKCLNLKCPYFHLKWTKRYAEQRRDLLHSTSGAYKIDTNIFQQKRTTDAGIQHQAKVNSTVPANGGNSNHFLEQFREMSKTVENLQSLMNSHLIINQPPPNQYTQEHHRAESQINQNQPPPSSHYPTETLMIQNHPPPNYYTQANHYTQEYHHAETPIIQNQPPPSSYTPAPYPTETPTIQNHPPPNYYSQAQCPTENLTTLNQCLPNQALTFPSQEHYLAHQLQQIQHLHHPVHQDQTTV